MNGRTLTQLATAMRSTKKEARFVIDELERDGLLERVGDGRWRLSDDAERRYGRWLRELSR